MTSRKRNMITAAVFVMSLVLIVAGVMNGEVSTVLNKAINVCMECIGIG